MRPRTKIVATLGPACWDEDTLRAMILAGVTVLRINFSHADHDVTAEKIALIRRVEASLPGCTVAILADLQGPRIRVGALPPEGLALVAGTPVQLRTGAEGPGIPVDYAGLPGDVKPGDTILLDDGLIALEVTATDPAAGTLATQVRTGGLLTAHKGINVPGRALSVPALTAKDLADLAFALEQGVDLVALSFVRSATDVVDARARIHAQTDRPVPIIAKIEKPAAVEAFDAILAAADGIMVARGDLGVELPPERLPGVQKRLIAAANHAGKPVITATQMLDSMIRNPRPTRAEATDVANAILDGSDAIMLSGESATGAYPLLAVQMMGRIACEAETLLDYEGWTARVHVLAAHPPPPNLPGPAVPPDVAAVTEAICAAADHLAEEVGAAAVLALTASGASARLIAKYRPRARLIAVTDAPPTARALALTWGVEPLLLAAYAPTPAETLTAAITQALELHLLAPGDRLVVTGGPPIPGQTTFVQVRTAG